MSNLMQSDGADEEFAYWQYLAVGTRKIRQQALPHAGLYINCCHCSHWLTVKFHYGIYRSNRGAIV